MDDESNAYIMKLVCFFVLLFVTEIYGNIVSRTLLLRLLGINLMEDLKCQPLRSTLEQQH